MVKLYSLILLLLLSLIGDYQKQVYSPVSKMPNSKVYVQDDFKVYSNPNSTRAIVTFQSVNQGKGLVTLFYSDGRLIKKEQVNVNKGTNTWEYKLPGNLTGICLVEFRMDNIRSSGKMFKSGQNP